MHLNFTFLKFIIIHENLHVTLSLSYFLMALRMFLC